MTTQPDISTQSPEAEPHDAVPLRIGAELRAERERLGRTLDSIADELNISRGYLRAIEEGTRDGLPGVGYVLGYVRGYAGEVGYDPELAVDRYKAEMAIPENLRLRDAPHIVRKQRKPMPRGLVPALLVLAGALAFAVYYGWQAADGPEIVAEDEGADAAPVVVSADTLTLRAETASWIEVRAVAEGGAPAVVFSGIMVPGQTLHYPRASGPVVHVRDAGAIALELGGERVGPLGPRGRTLEGLSLLEVLQRPRAEQPDDPPDAL